MVTLTLNRFAFRETYTVGKLTVDGKYLCDTLEDKNRDMNHNGEFDNGEVKVFGETCIPFGRYRVTLTYSDKFKRVLPAVWNVNSFSGIRIHAGNKPEDTHGCILVGENKVKGGLINSRAWEERITEMIRGWIAEGHEVYLNIV